MNGFTLILEPEVVGLVFLSGLMSSGNSEQMKLLWKRRHI